MRTGNIQHPHLSGSDPGTKSMNLLLAGLTHVPLDVT